MMRLRMAAVDVSEMEELGLFAVSFGEDPSEPGRFLQIAIMLEPSDVDFDIGQATYSITDEVGRCTYGGIREWRLTPGRLEVFLTEKAADILGADEGFDISFPSEVTDTVRDGVTRVMEIAAANAADEMA
jgi:hypothetical protein